MIITTYQEALFFAEAAFNHVKETTPLGSDNRATDIQNPIKKHAASAAIENARQDYYRIISKSNQESVTIYDENFEQQFLKQIACEAASHGLQGAGNCGAQTAIGFCYLLLCNVRPISYAAIGLKHAFFIVGDVNNPNRALVCDPHSDEHYVLSMFKNHTAARLYGNEINIIIQCNDEWNDQQMQEIFNRKPISLPPDINRNIKHFFIQKFLEYTRKKQVFLSVKWSDKRELLANSVPELPIIRRRLTYKDIFLGMIK